MELVYSISRWDIVWPLLLGSPFIILVTLLATAIDQSKSPEVRRLFKAMGIFVGVTVMGFSLFGNILPTRALAAAMEEGRAQVVQGPVESFAHWGKGRERFVVSGVRFEYSEHSIEPGFRFAHGPVRPGRWVRIHYVRQPDRNVIVRLEVHSSQTEVTAPPAFAP